MVEGALVKSPDGRYVRKAFIGRGSFKTVYRAFDEVEALGVAWNEVNVTTASDVDADAANHEVAMLARLSHPHIMAIMAVWTEALDSGERRQVFVTELLSSGSVRQFLRESTERKVPVRGAKLWGRQILAGLVYLHENGVIHRDIKCDNLFINGHTGVVKIGDFGLSRLTGSRVGSVIGTPEFMAPEIYEEAYTCAVDVYAFGMCLLEMVTGKFPYSECENRGQVFYRAAQRIPPQALGDLMADEALQEVGEVVSLCFRECATRPSAAALLAHPFFLPTRPVGPPLFAENAAGMLTLVTHEGGGSSASSSIPHSSQGAGSSAPPAGRIALQDKAFEDSMGVAAAIIEEASQAMLSGMRGEAAPCPRPSSRGNSGEHTAAKSILEKPLP
eukprot:TRINITY_DN30774_c0_g1_i1.p1 TRINITY_DN30774_c0_g1~~TRINITY_DN30774_c0_g1_i1.p1  ORF type:complete len:388 (+),score=119.37 TRINITY_DN30774_c0_g1_i1:61-1224(+)